VNVFFACTEREDGDPCTVTKLVDGVAYVVQDEYATLDIPGIPICLNGARYYEDVTRS